MILGFRHKGLEAFYRMESTRGIQANHAARLARILSALDAASTPNELNLPTFRLHPLKEKLKEHWAIWVNKNWRVTFRFSGPDIIDVDYVDYH